MSRSLRSTMADVEVPGLQVIEGSPYGGYDATAGQATDPQRAGIVLNIVSEMSFSLGMAAWTASEAGIPAPLTAPLMYARSLVIYSLVQQFMQLTFALTNSEKNLVPVNSAFSYLSLTSRSIAAVSGLAGLETSPRAVAAWNSIFNLGVKNFRFANADSPRAFVDLVRAQYGAIDKVGKWARDWDAPLGSRDRSETDHAPIEPSISADPPAPPEKQRGTPADYGLTDDDTSGDEDIELKVTEKNLPTQNDLPLDRLP